MELTKAEAVEKLQKWCPAGATIYGIVRSRSKSGMSRRIDFYTFIDNSPLYLTGYVAAVIGQKRPTTDGGLRISGAGMDMIAHTVEHVGHVIGHKLRSERL